MMFAALSVIVVAAPEVVNPAVSPSAVSRVTWTLAAG
jgi:hypothetical protein